MDINGERFSLKGVYEFEEKLFVCHPENHRIQPKIR